MKKDKWTLLAYIAVCIFWGATYLGIKIGIEYYPPLLFSGTRFVIAGLIMFIFAKIKGLSFPHSFKEFFPIALVGCFMLAGGNGLVTLAELKVSSSIASLFIALVPIYIAIIEIILFKSMKLSKMGYIGLFIGFIGVCMLINPFGSELFVTVEGIFMLLGAGILWSIGSVKSKTLSHQVHIIPSISIQMLSGGFILLLIGLIKGETVTTYYQPKGLLALLYLVCFGSLLAYSCYIYVLSKWPAAKAGTYTYVNPAVAVLLGYIFLKEEITILMFLSMVVILLSVYIVQRFKIKGNKNS